LYRQQPAPEIDSSFFDGWHWIVLDLLDSRGLLCRKQ